MNNLKKALADLINGASMYKIWLYHAWHTLGAKYKRTIFGTLWIAGNFLFSSFAIALVFGSVFKMDIRSFLPFCLLGNLFGAAGLWVITEAPELYVGNAGVIRNHAYPFSYFCFESVAKLAMLTLHNLVIFYIFMIVIGTFTIPLWVAIPGFILMFITLFIWGPLIGMLASRYRDLRFLLPNLSTLLFFVTPIYWDPATLGTRKWIAEVNPLYHMISIIRLPLLGKYPTALDWIYVSAFAGVGIVLWLIFFSAFRRRIAFWV